MNWLDELAWKVARMTAGEWHQDGEEIYVDGFSLGLIGSFNDTTESDMRNVSGIVALRNNAERLLAVARAAGKALNAWDAGNEEAEMDALRAALEWK